MAERSAGVWARRLGLTRDDLGEWARGLGACAAAGTFLAAVNAFAFEGMGFVQRATYWVPLMVVGGMVGTLVSRPIFGTEWASRRPWLGLLASILAMTPPLTLVVWAATTLFFGREWRLDTLFWQIGPVGLISAAMTVIGYLSDRRPRETHVAAAGASPPRFLDRLPAKLRGAELYAVEAEDHYLRIHTDRGSDLILMRLTDAVGELEGIEGAQTHRSWWVAKDAVVEVTRGDGRATFVLRNGIRAPVSRSYARALRAEGWY